MSSGGAGGGAGEFGDYAATRLLEQQQLDAAIAASLASSTDRQRGLEAGHNIGQDGARNGGWGGGGLGGKEGPIAIEEDDDDLRFVGHERKGTCTVWHAYSRGP